MVSCEYVMLSVIVPICFIHVRRNQRELSKNMNFIFSKNKLSKNFYDFQIVQEKYLGGNIVWIYQNEIDVLC